MLPCRREHTVLALSIAPQPPLLRASLDVTIVAAARALAYARVASS